MNLQMVTTTDIQRSFPKILASLDEPVIVMRDSKPEAVVILYEDYKDYLLQRRRVMADRVRLALARVQARTAGVSEKELEDDIKGALREAGSN